jgi:CheY-like chemotaxis protein/PAS domain-containing protein
LRLPTRLNPPHAKPFTRSKGELSRDANPEQVILHRHLKALLHRLGIEESQPPDEDRWLALLVLLNDRFRKFEEDRHRLQRSLDVHSREVQALYKELTDERDKVSSALACLDQALLLLDPQGRPLLLSAEAERLLGWSESELEGKDVLALLGLDEHLPGNSLTRALQGLRPLYLQLELKCRQGPTPLEMELQPLVRERQLTGCLLLLREPAEEEPAEEEDVASASLEPEEPVAAVTQEDLPAVPEAPAEVPTTATAPSPLRILIVESEPDSSRQIQEQLESLGHQWVHVSHAEEGLRSYQEAPYDAILCCENPFGYSGVELCKKLRQDSRGGYPYFILMTPPGARQQAAKALEAGVDAFLNKPLDAVELTVRLKVARGVQTRLNRVYSNLMSPKS